MRRLHVLAEQVDVAFDRDRLAVTPREVGRDAVHQEVRVIAEEDEYARRGGEPRGFPVERQQLLEMLVRQDLEHQIVRGCRQAGGQHVGRDQLVVDTLGLGAGEHLGREVEAVEALHALRPQPGADAAGAAGQVEHAAGARPVHAFKAREQAQVHLVLDYVLVGLRPLAIAVAHSERRIAAAVERRELHGGLG